jgi:hypothetical protein
MIKFNFLEDTMNDSTTYRYNANNLGNPINFKWQSNVSDDQENSATIKVAGIALLVSLGACFVGLSTAIAGIVTASRPITIAGIVLLVTGVALALIYKPKFKDENQLWRSNIEQQLERLTQIVTELHEKNQKPISNIISEHIELNSSSIGNAKSLNSNPENRTGSGLTGHAFSVTNQASFAVKTNVSDEPNYTF